MPITKCLRCGHKWVGGILVNGKIKKPKFCPRCHSPNYRRKKMLRKRTNKWR